MAPAARPAHGLPLVAAEIVDDDDVAGFEGWYEHLLDVGQEAFTIDRTVDDARSRDAIATQRGEEGQRPPAAMRGFGDQPFAPGGAPVAARHVGLGPGLVDEDQAGRIKPPLILFPLRPAPGDVGTILLAGAQAFF